MISQEIRELWLLMKSEFAEYTNFLVPDRTKQCEILTMLETLISEEFASASMEETILKMKNMYWKVFDICMGDVLFQGDEGETLKIEYIENDIDLMIRHALDKINQKVSDKKS